MTKLQALHSFLSSFGLPAYEENAIAHAGDALKLPYITYTVQLDNLYGGSRPIVLTAWYRTDTPKPLETFQAEVAESLGITGKVLPCDGGYLWFRRGQPFANLLDDPADKYVKRVIINLQVEYNTAL